MSLQANDPEYAQIKRVWECFLGDPNFRHAALTQSIGAQELRHLRDIGVAAHAPDLGFLSAMGEEGDPLAFTPRRLPEMHNLALRYSWLRAWLRATRQDDESTQLASAWNDRVRHPHVRAWRSRRMAAVHSELGIADTQLMAPIVAVELADGCSQGCWFCAFAARPLRATVEYARHQTLFQGVITSCLELLGADIGPVSLLFHATEPYDTPRYVDFLRDFERLSGVKPFTSTAVSAGAWLDQLLDFYGQAAEHNLRVTIFDPAELARLHARYSPQALAGVELVMRSASAHPPLARSGRLLGAVEDLRSAPAGEAVTVPQTSIACLNGFQINLVTRTIKLIAPCHACAQWPLGYRIFDHATFEDERDFPRALGQLIARAMPVELAPQSRLAFRDDLVFRSTPGGCALISPRQRHQLSFARCAQSVWTLLASGDYTVESLLRVCQDEKLGSPFFVSAALRRIFDLGLLDEVCRTRRDAGEF